MQWLRLRREIGTSRWQFLSVALIVALGIGMFSSSYMSFRNLKSSYDYSYERLHFADYWVSLPGFPPGGEVERALEAEGVGRAEARLVASLPARVMSSTTKKSYILGMDLDFVKKYLPAREGPVAREPRKLELRIHSVPDGRRPAVNDLLIVEGNYAETPGEVMIEQRLADFHELAPDDEITLITPAGEEKAFRVAAVVRSPEFIWVARSRQDIFPSPDVFGVAFMPESALRDLLFKGSPSAAAETPVNEVAFVTGNRAVADRVLAALPEGSTLIDRDSQLSNELLKMDLDGYRQIAIFFPALFLVVGALSLYVLLARTVHAQRRVIGTMRALGYSAGTILRYYLTYALAAGLLGSVPGVLFGLALSSRVTELYVSLIGIPLAHSVPQYGVVAVGVFLGLLTAVLGAIVPARSAAALLPAEAMREVPPDAGRKPWLERLLPPLERLPGVYKVGFRDLFRNPRRSLYTVFGVAVATSLILVSTVMFDSSDFALQRQFGDIESYDVRASFNPPATPDLERELSARSDVDTVQGIVEVPVKLYVGKQWYTTVLQGLAPDGHLLDLRPAGVSDSELKGTGDKPDKTDMTVLRGIYLGAALREKFGIGEGDVLEVKSLLDQSIRRLEVLGFAEVPLGAMAYGEKAAVARTFDLPDVSTTLFFSMEGDRRGLIDDLQARADLISIMDQQALRDSLKQMMKLFYAFIGVMLAFGGLLALAIIFNTTSINILERERELATMRTLGTPDRAINLMVTLQGLLLGTFGLVIGGFMGLGLSVAALGMWESDLFSFPVVAYPRTYLITAATIIAVLLLSQIPALRHIARLNLAEAVKQREG